MKAKRFFANVILLVIVSAVVFFIGWMSFYVKQGQFSIMTSKTGGLYREPIVYGKFKWRWERLLPTNVTLSSYNLQGYSYVQSTSGTLPSAELYRTMLDPKPDFSYNLTAKISFSVEPEKILSMVRTGTIENTPESLEEYLRLKSITATNLIADHLIKNGKTDFIASPSVLTKAQIDEALSVRLGEFDGLKVDSVELASAKIPDTKLYELAKSSYESYLSGLNEIILKKAEGQASSILELENSMKQLEKFATLLERYPKFNDFSKSENLSGVMNKLIQAE